MSEIESGNGSRSTARKIALVTGATGGIGRATAAALARSGHDVAVTAREARRLDETCVEIAAHGVRAHGWSLDVSDPESVRAAMDGIRAVFGAPTVLVNNAGVASAMPFGKVSLEEWDTTFAVNTRGAFLVTQACLPSMLEAGSGRIVNIASTAALQGYRYTAHYTASKHALLGMTRALAAEVGRKGVTVNCVCPGFVDTEMTQRSVDNLVETAGLTAEDARKALAKQNAQGRLIQPSEVAAAVVYLAGNDARGVNGQALVI